jgi:23S rRNA (uracil1939-C5)-methyltransferase
MTITTTIESLGHKGEGIAQVEDRKVFVPLALPGETVNIAVEGDRGTLLAVLEPSGNRVEPFCPHFGACGGCQLQHMDRPSYAAFKIGLVETPLRLAGIDAKVERFIDVAGEGRRRATLHARREGASYMRLRSHQVHDIDACPILVPALARRAPELTRAVLAAVGEADVSLTATLTGLDVAVRTEIKQARADRLAPLVGRFKLARLALNGELVLQTQPPLVEMGRARVEVPIGSFLQATASAEQALADYVVDAVGGAKSVADLFCGTGPFALRVAETRPVFAADSHRAAIAALDKAARHTKRLREITARPRDLFRDPLTQFELPYEVVVLDPPRAGAQAQVGELVKSKVQRIVMVACDPRTFARDAARLVQAGFRMERLVAMDQFAQSAHVEIAATFSR